MLDTETVEETKLRNVLDLSFMRSKARPATRGNRPSLLEMTREEFTSRLRQHKKPAPHTVH